MRRSVNVRFVKLLVVLFLAFIIMFIFGINAFARENENERVKYVTTIDIKYGDTLTSIAKEYYTDDYKNLNEYINEIRVSNNICGDKIFAGDKLIVPYYIH